MINCFGEWEAICLQSSLPMEPPPPVTRTTLPRKWSRTSSVLIRMGSRPNKSSTSTSFNLDTDTSPFTSWYIPGRVRSLQPDSLQISRISFLVWVDAEGMAMIISSMLYCCTASRILSRVPTMGTPRRSFPWHPGPSSMTHLTWRFRYSLLSISFKIIFPAAPAPIIITLILDFRPTTLLRLFCTTRSSR